MEGIHTKRLSFPARIALFIPFFGGVFFGIGPLLFPQQLSHLFRYSGSDEIISQIAGAATLGYALALWNVIRRATWKESKFVITGTFFFNLVSVYACVIEILAHTQEPVVYAILVTSLIIMAITGRLLLTYKLVPVGRPTVSDISGIVLGLFTIATIAFGVLLLFPVVAAKLFSLAGTDFFLYRQAAAAVLGYSVIAILQMRSRRFDEIDLPLLMEVAFTGLTFAVCVYQLLHDNSSAFVYALTFGSSLASIGLLAVLFNEGK